FRHPALHRAARQENRPAAFQMAQHRALGSLRIAANHGLGNSPVLLEPQLHAVRVASLDADNNAVNLVADAFHRADDFAVAEELAQQQVEGGILGDIPRDVAGANGLPLPAEVLAKLAHLGRRQSPGDAANYEHFQRFAELEMVGNVVNGQVANNNPLLG